MAFTGHNLNQFTKLLGDNKECLACYFGIFEPFTDFDNISLRAYYSRGIRFFYQYAITMKAYFNFQVEDSEYTRKCISASLIMNNDVDDNIDYILENPPLNFWYPKSPKKDTCLKLINKNKAINLGLIVLSLINKWTDIIELCEFDKKDKLLKILSYRTLDNDDFKEFGIDYELGEFDPYVGFCDYSFNLEEEEEYTLDAEMRTYANDLYYTNNSSLEYIIYKNQFFIPFPNFTKEDIKYNFLLCNYILLNHEKFDPHICSLALSNRVAFGFMDEDLIEKYDVFYMFTYKVPVACDLMKYYAKFPHLKYNIAMVFCYDLYASYEYKQLDLEPDLDIYYLAKFYGHKCIEEDMLKKYEIHKKWYRHLDFENCRNIAPKEVTFDDKIELGNIILTSRFN